MRELKKIHVYSEEFLLWFMNKFIHYWKMFDHEAIHSLVENGLHDPEAYFLTALHYNGHKTEAW